MAPRPLASGFGGGEGPISSSKGSENVEHGLPVVSRLPDSNSVVCFRGLLRFSPRTELVRCQDTLLFLLFSRIVGPSRPSFLARLSRVWLGSEGLLLRPSRPFRPSRFSFPLLSRRSSRLSLLPSRDRDLDFELLSLVFGSKRRRSGDLDLERPPLGRPGPFNLGCLSIRRPGDFDLDRLSLRRPGDFDLDRLSLRRAGDFDRDRLSLSWPGDLDLDCLSLRESGDFDLDCPSLRRPGDFNLGCPSLRRPGDLDFERLSLRRWRWWGCRSGDFDLL